MKRLLLGALAALLIGILPVTVISADAPADPAPVTEPVPDAQVTCEADIAASLQKYFEYREWDESHIEILEKAIATWEIGYSPIDLSDYRFWSGNDERNLKAFVRDQRFGYAEDSIVVEVSETVRYTVFLCECGITAIYRGIKVVVVQKPTPPKKHIPPVTPPDSEIPTAWCVEPGTTIRKDC
ncbi:MAG TPA: hypothetical protein VHS96_11355 [Bacteroidia bacterium]|nr:hypothetical protein [Bacteroidia bacterium]